MANLLSKEEILEEASIIKKIDSNFPPSDLMGDVMIHCFCKHISLIIAHQVPLNKSMWEYQLNPNVKRLKEIITEQSSDVVDETRDPKELLRMDALVRRYEQMCKCMNTNFIYAYTYNDRVFYNVDCVGDLDHQDEKKMWKLEVLTPGRVRKKIRAKKEPAQEYLLDRCGMPRESEAESDVIDFDDL